LLRVASENFALVALFSTSDTVDCETPVSFAMSVIVGRRCVDFFIV
jgi:hypothetical protein